MTDEFRPKVRTVVDVELRLPDDGPDRARVAEVAERLERSVENFVAYSMMYVTQRILEEDESPEEIEYTTAQAVRDTADRIPADAPATAQRMEMTVPHEAPTMTDVDEIAEALGLSRDAYVAACVAANVELQAWLLDDPQQQEYWDEIQAQVDALPDGYEDSVFDGLEAEAPEVDGVPDLSDFDAPAGSDGPAYTYAPHG